MVLSGQRLPSAEMIDRISRHFELKVSEHRYFELLVQLEKCRRKNSDPRSVIAELCRMRPDPTTANIDASSFAYIAEWYHFVIKQIIATDPKMNEPRLIVRSMRAGITEGEVRKALQTMMDLGIVSKGESGAWVVAGQRITTTQGIPDQALRKHHKGMITRALASIDESDFHNREITSITLRIDADRMVEAKKAIREFRDEFHRQFESVVSKNVYQLNFQLFEHTKPVKVNL